MLHFQSTEQNSIEFANAPLVWKLYQHKYYKKLGRSGFHPEAISQLSSGLEVAQVAQWLNTEKCFDFEYTPQINDLLKIINVTLKHEFLCLRYNGQQWEGGSHNPYWEVIELFRGGVITT